MHIATKTALLCLLVAGCAVPLSDELDLVNFSKDPDAVDVTGQAQVVTCTMNIPDGAGGGGGDANTVRYAACSFKSPQGRSQGCLATSAVGDDWSCPMTLPADSEGSAIGTTWTIEYVFAENVAGDKLFATGAEIEADQADGEVDLLVITSTPDTSQPIITSFTLDKATVDPGDTVTCTITATDESPITVRGCSFVPGDGSSSVSCVNSEGGDSCAMDIPGTADAGVTYTEINHFARDRSLNVAIADSAQTFATTAAGGAGGQGGSAGAGGASGAGGAGGVPACTGGAYDTPDMQAIDGQWDNSTVFASATDDLTAEVWVRWTAAGADSGIGITQYPSTTTFSELAAIVRVGDSDEIQVRYGDTDYRCDDGVGGTTCPTYTANTWYKFRFVIDINAGTYDVLYEACDSPGLTVLADDFPLRGAASNWEPLAYYAVWSDPSQGAVEVNHTDGVWTPSCTPLVCTDYHPTLSCGTPPDGCGGTLSCPACAGVCDAGYVCCTQNPTWCADEVPAKDCGTWPDNCGVTVDCGDLDCGDGAGGDVCEDGTCCTPESAAVSCSGLECGNTTNNCGQTVDCDVVTGGCTGGEVCVGNTCQAAGSRGPQGHWPPDVPAYTTAATATTNGTMGDLQTKLAACSGVCVIEHAGDIVGSGPTFTLTTPSSGGTLIRPPIGQRNDHDLVASGSNNLILDGDDFYLAGYWKSGRVRVLGVNTGLAWTEGTGSFVFEEFSPNVVVAGLYEVVIREYSGAGDRIVTGGGSFGGPGATVIIYGSWIAGSPAPPPQHADTLQHLSGDGTTIVDSIIWASFDKSFQCESTLALIDVENSWLATAWESGVTWNQNGYGPSWCYSGCSCDGTTCNANAVGHYCRTNINNSTYLGQFRSSAGRTNTVSNSELFNTNTDYVDAGGNTTVGTRPLPPSAPTHVQLDSIWSP